MRSDKVLRRLAKFKPGEKKLAVLIFLYFFLIAAPYTIINALRTSNFIYKEGVGSLPVAYLLAVIATGLIVFWHARLQDRKPLRGLIIPSLIFFAATGMLIPWLLQTGFGQRTALVDFIYWVWASVLITVLITGFWMTVNDIYNPRQARRLIVFLNSGGILGSVLGGSLVAGFSHGPAEKFLMPMACVMMVGAAAVVGAVFRLRAIQGRAPAPEGPRPPAPAGHRAGFLESFREVRGDRLLAPLAAVVAIGIVVSTCVEFQFLSAAYLHIPRREALQAFFGFFDAGLTVFAFLLNILMAGFLLRKLAVARALLFTPVLLLAGSAAVLIAPFSLFSGIFIRGLDEGLTFSVNHPFREILYIPVPARLRHKAKAFIEMFVSQFAKAAGAVVLLLFALALNKEVDNLTPRWDPQLARFLSGVVVALLVPWMLSARKLGRAYISAVKENIQPLWDRGDEILAGKVDVEYAKLVFDTIDSRNYSTVLYALHLFDLLAQRKLSPELRNAIAVKAEEVQAKALSDRLETGAAAFVPEVLEELPLDDLANEIPIILSSAAYQQVMGGYVEKLLARGAEAEVEKMELAKALGLMPPDSPLAGCLGRLIEDESAVVGGLALRSAAKLKRSEDIPAVIRRLRRVGTLHDALNALEAYGDAALGELEACLRDPATEFIVRSAVVEALGRIGLPRAVQILTEELIYGTGELDGRLIDVLDRLQAANVPVPLSEAAAKRKTFALIKRFCRDFLDLHREGENPDALRLRHLLARNLEVTFADIFKLLGLYYPQKDIRRVFQNLRTGGPNAVTHAVEWLDNTLSRELHEVLVPLVDDLNLEEKKARFRKILTDLGDL
jgi:AAA family ATP:ADP antiporter